MLRRRSGLLVGSVLLSVTAIVGCNNGSGSTKVSSLEHYMDVAYGTTEQNVERDYAMVARFEETIAQCMKDQGFEYYLVERMTDSVGFPNTDSREFRKLYGYGVSTSPPYGDTFEIDDSQNEAYRESLSPEQRDAYDIAMQGTSTEADHVVTDSGGCYDQAWEAVYGSAGDIGQEWDALMEDLDALWAQIADSPEVTAINADWAKCMSDHQFFDLTTPDSAPERIWALMTATQRPDATGLVQTDHEALASVQEVEIRMAITDWDCQKRVDYDARYETARIRYENKFVETHKPELEAWSLAMSKRRN